MKIDPEEVMVDFTKEIGSGIQARVLEGTYNNEEVAVKVAHKEPAKPRYAVQLEREFKAMVAAGFHSNIVRLIGLCKHPQWGDMLVMERCRTTLRAWLDACKRNNLQNPQWRVKILLDIAQGFAHLHSKDWLHCDLSPHNILIDPFGTVKLADFGLARTSEDDLKLTGNVFWAANEVLPLTGQPKYFSKAVDVYSFGVIVWELFHPMHPEDVFDQDTDECMRARSAGDPLPMPPDCPQEWRDFISDCCNYYPDERPSFPQIIQRLKEMETPAPPIPVQTEFDSSLNNGGYV